jgi:hypothetical protein
MTKDLSSESSQSDRGTEEEESNIISNLGIGPIFEGVGNIINVIGKVTEEGGVSQEKPVRRGHECSEGVGG